MPSVAAMIPFGARTARATGKETATTTQPPMGDGRGEIKQSASRWGGGDSGWGCGDDDDDGRRGAANRRRFVTQGIRDDGEAKTTDDVVTNNRSEDDDLWEGDRHATGAVDALNWLTTTVYVSVGLDGDRSSSLAQEADVSQFSVRYEYLL